MRRKVSFAAILGVLAFVVSPAAADFYLNLSVPQKDFLIYEPVFIVASLTNNGTAEANIFTCLQPEAAFLKITVTGPDGKKYDYRPLFQADLAADYVKNLSQKLSPAQSYSQTIELTPTGTQPDFSAGEYRLNATYTLGASFPGGPIDISSNTAIAVVKPSAGEMAPYELLLSAEKSKTGLRDPRLAACYREIISKHTSSRYAAISRHYLAQISEYEAGQTLRGTANARPAYMESARLYAEASNLLGETPLGLYAKRLSARCEAKLGNSETALKLLDAVINSNSATDSDKKECIAWKEHVKSGLFERESGLK